MRTIGTIVSLRWALTWAALRKSVWQTVGYAISLLLGLSLVVVVGLAAWLLGDPDGVGGTAAFAQGLQVGVVLAGGLIVLMTAFIQLMLIGESSTMSPRRLELYGIPDRTLHAGLLVAGLSGIPAVAGLLALLLWSMAYRPLGAGAVVGAVVAAPLAIVTTVSLSKMLISLSTTLVRSSRGKNMFYLIVMVVFVAACYLPSITVNTVDVDRFTVATFAGPASVVGWTPFGAAFALPFDVAHGDWLAFAGRVAMLAAVWVVCFMVSTWCLRHERMVAGAETAGVSAKGIGAFGWMPDSVSGAVSARLLTYLKRDPRQSLMFVFPVFFVILLAFQAQGESIVVWMAPVISAMVMTVTESDGLAYDGRGLTMQVIGGVRGVDDRRGRVRVYAGIILAYMLVLMAVCFVVTGDWRTTDGILTGLTFSACAVGLGLCALGLAEVLSCVLMYPVPSMSKPFSAPQGRAVAQGFFPLIQILGMFVLMVPTAVVGVALLLTGNWALYWVLIPVGLADGVVFLALGSWLGGKLMDARMLSIVQTLDSFASLQK